MAFTGTLSAQEPQDTLRKERRMSLLTGQQRLLLAYPSELVVLGFRRYEIVQESVSQRRAFGIEPAWIDADSDDDKATASGWVQGAGLSIPLAAESVQMPVFEQVGRFALMEALRFGYQFFRESTRSSSLTEFDYLQLPQGSGMFRTLNEVNNEALMRGEMQSQKVHEARKELEKNTVKEKR